MFPTRSEPPRALVVVGGSAGSIGPLREILGALPADLDAMVLAVVHTSRGAGSRLDTVLGRAGALPTAFAADGETLRPGIVRVARAGRHLLVADTHLELSAGARENWHRPAIDPLFRTAAHAYRDRCVSVLLSGALDDGAAGTGAVRLLGGATIAQDPAEATVPSMPRSAVRAGTVDHVASSREIGELVVGLVGDAAQRGATAPGAGPTDAGVTRGFDREIDLREPSVFSCPDCGGVMEPKPGPVPQWVCRVGHRFSPATLEAAQASIVEDALWTALRALEEQQSLAQRVAARARGRGSGRAADAFELRARETADRAERIRALLRDGHGDPDEPSTEGIAGEEVVAADASPAGEAAAGPA